MAGSVQDKDRGYARALGSLRALARGAHVVVGIRGAKGAAREPGSPLTLVQVAAVNEYGSEDGRIPERSFLRSTFDAKKGAIAAELAAGLKKVVVGELKTEVLLGKVGLRLAADVVETVTAGVPPPNAPLTVIRKGSTHTLIDTGRLRQSIDHEVRRGSGKEGA